MQIEKGSLEIKSIKENPANPNQYVATVTLPGYKDESAYIDKKIIFAISKFFILLILI